jgi:N6-L-threonylcarbamoyladenine synthase
MEKYILGIETSCDDTSIAILKGIPESTTPPELISFNSFSQELMLEKWGGVVPEIAARNHLAKLVPLLKHTFTKAKLTPDRIDLISVTNHPGLLGPLLTGINGAKTLSLINKTPILPVNHLYAHLEAIFLTEELAYPYIGLLVSGGHSIIFKVKNCSSFEIIGSTIDDAAGEAFDKGGKILGLGYPAGKIIDDLAKNGDRSKYKFPIGLNKKTVNMSFSGVKTSLRTHTEKYPNFKENIEDLCASYQEAIIMALYKKLKLALSIHGDLPVVVGGGVACNARLREVLKENINHCYFVSPQFCTDNGAMIANFGLRNFNAKVPFPDCLGLDAKS